MKTYILLFLFVAPPLLAAIPEGDPIVGPDGNLLVNGNFQAKDEYGRPLRWSRQLPTDRSFRTDEDNDAIVTQEQKHGLEAEDASVKIMDDSESEGYYLRSEKRLAVAGVQYEASAWVKSGSGTPAMLFIEFWNVNNERVLYQSGTISAGSGWQQVTIPPVTAPPATQDNDGNDVVTLHVTVSIFTSAAAKGDSYWDDVVLKPVVNYDSNVTPGVRELFMDNYRLESSFDVERVVHAAVKSDPLISKDKGWEKPVIFMTGTVLKDTPVGTGYRMWYYSNAAQLFAVSSSGTNWTKPTLNTHPYGSGSMANNIAFPRGIGRITLVYDPQEPAKAYKAMLYDPLFTEPRGLGYYYYYSATGTSNWLPGNGGNPIFPAGDQGNVAYHQISPTTREFIATTKQRTLNSDTMAAFMYDRMAFVATSTDFENWQQPGGGDHFAIAVESDQADDFAAQSRRSTEGQLYGMPVYPYESVFIGFAWTLEVTDYETGAGWFTGNGPLSPQLAVSRDLKLWDRPNRTRVIPVGTKGAWDDGVIYTAAGNLIVDGNSMHVYYSGASLGHSLAIPASGTKGSIDILPEGKEVICHIARATWRRDGFVSMHNAAAGNPGDAEGYVQTGLLTFSGASTLRVNAKLNSGGSLRVEVLDANGSPLPGFSYANATPVTGDQFGENQVQWSGASIAALAGTPTKAATPFKLKFYLKGGDLYSYWFE